MILVLCSTLVSEPLVSRHSHHAPCRSLALSLFFGGTLDLVWSGLACPILPSFPPSPLSFIHSYSVQSYPILLPLPLCSIPPLPSPFCCSKQDQTYSTFPRTYWTTVSKASTTSDGPVLYFPIVCRVSIGTSSIALHCPWVLGKKSKYKVPEHTKYLTEYRSPILTPSFEATGPLSSLAPLSPRAS